MGDLNMNHPAAAINSEILFPMCKIKLNEIELPNGQHSFSLLVLTVKETMDICFLLKLYNIYQVRWETKYHMILYHRIELLLTSSIKNFVARCGL